MTETRYVFINKVSVGVVHKYGDAEEGFPWDASPWNGSPAGCTSYQAAVKHVKEEHITYMAELPDRLHEAEKTIKEVREAMIEYKGTM